MGTATQKNRLLKITTQLPDDYLLINQFSCEEAISELFEVEIELLHEEDDDDVFRFSPVDVNQVLGQKATIEIRQEDGGGRYFSGIFRRLSQIGRDRNFSKYKAILVPHVWVLTQNFNSRIFQHITVPDILAQIFEGYEVKFQLQRTYNKRNYCVQYQETDFNFASRLMEEEGIYYYFEHSSETDRMVIRDDFKNPEDCPRKADIAIFDAELQGKDRWESAIGDVYLKYELTSGKHVFWDHHFQLPTKKLDTEKVSRFNVGGNQEMEVYKFPGGYARKYDGVDKTGGKQTDDLNNIFEDNKTTATNTMLSNDSGYMKVHGISNCASFTAGYRFNLSNHPNREINGAYILTGITHQASQNPGYIVGGGEVGEAYTNQFSCIPHGSGHPEFRPEQKTKKPVITGSQSAYVVGPAGEEIYTDEYGRVKVQFHWDREGEVDANSSCWLRVLQAWAGNRWGMMFIPRIGMEVIVNFLEGDPDQPVVSGCVYNPQTMPPYELPAEKTKMTIKSDSSKGGKGFNELRFEDKKGDEQIFIHGQRDLDMRIRSNRRELVGNDRHLVVGNDKREHIKGDDHKLVDGSNYEEYGGNHQITIGGSKSEDVGGNFSQTIGGNSVVQTGGNRYIETGGNHSIKAGANLVLEAGTAITLKVGGNFITITQGGIMIQGTIVLINSGGAAMPVLPVQTITCEEPKKAHIADNADPGDKTGPYKQKKKKKKKHKPKSTENKDKKSFIKIKLVDEQNNPVEGERYRVTLPDGETIAEGRTDVDGRAEVTNIDTGNCKVTFPNLDKGAWKAK